MKFLVVKELNLKRYVSSEAVRLGILPHTTATPFVLLLATAETVKEDFNMSDECPVVYSHSSIQIRPKTIYHCDKGYYKKVDGKKHFFDEGETVEIENAITKLKNYLKSNFNVIDED